MNLQLVNQATQTLQKMASSNYGDPLMMQMIKNLRDEYVQSRLDYAQVTQGSDASVRAYKKQHLSHCDCPICMR